MMKRMIWVALVLGATYFALQAGEYSTIDILRLRDQRTRIGQEVDSLQRQVDSLKSTERLIRGDPATQERIAREEFGMVRGENEILYKFVEQAEVDSMAHDNQDTQ